MSLEALTWAIKQKIPSSADKFVLVALANYADQHGQSCFPSVSKIAEFTSLSRATIQRSLRWLEKSDFIKTQTRFANNRQSSNIYTLTWRGLTVMPLPSEGPQDDTGGASPRRPRGPHSEAQNLHKSPSINLKKDSEFDEGRKPSKAFLDWEKRRKTQ